MDWKLINPDIFGSMIQSIADEKARSELGMHYTSVPNIMKVLGPLFLDDLDAEIEKAWDKPAALRTQLARLSKIRVFDPACGSGNFLVVAYRQMRERELRLMKRLGELDPGTTTMQMFSSVGLDQFYGIEINDFAAETAKLALFIAEYQANARLADLFGRMPPLLPLRDGGNVICGNSLRLAWEEVCPLPEGDEEVFIAGNPPFVGFNSRANVQSEDMDWVLRGRLKTYHRLDYVICWFVKASDYIRGRQADAALVATNSICQGATVDLLWPELLVGGVSIKFAYQQFYWVNNAANNAAVACVIVGLSGRYRGKRKLFDGDLVAYVNNINPYLLDAENLTVRAASRSLFGLPKMDIGNIPRDDGYLILSPDDRNNLLIAWPEAARFVRRFMGSKEVVRGTDRYCLWIKDEDAEIAGSIPEIARRLEVVKNLRLRSDAKVTRDAACVPYRFGQMTGSGEAKSHSILVPRVTSERRPYLAVEKFGPDVISSDLNQVLYDAPDWCVSLIASRMHLVWIATVCGRLESRFRYSSTMGWNTFAVPKFTIEQLDHLSASARRILKTRYEHHPATIAELYDPDKMPDDLRQAHKDNDDLLESMYIGRPFRNDTERLETLFKLYAAKTAQ